MSATVARQKENRIIDSMIRFLCIGSPERIRTAASALRGRRPRPLDDGAKLGEVVDVVDVGEVVDVPWVLGGVDNAVCTS